MEFLKASNIVKEFSNHRALDRVSITVPENSIFGLLGPNGAGKTTLIRIINQIMAPDEGELYLQGHPLKSGNISIIGYLPEERGLYKKMKVGEQALYLAQLKGMDRISAMRQLKYWFEKFEITSWWNKKVEELSKGMQQKVQFITTVVHEPRLMIFDEPFSGFDPINANLLKNEILRLREKGATIIFSTHNMASVEELCDHISLINKSRVILEGQIDELRKTFRTSTYEVSYTGDPEAMRKALPSTFEIISEKTNHEVNFAQIHSKTLPDNNLLISSLLPHIEIYSFNEVIPSMNDIFIRVVGETNAKEAAI
jgi:ABC-2 type transport system ATP-binding protein